MTEQRCVAVALCADRNIEPGVHVTLYSLLANAGCPVRIHFIHKGYAGADLDRLHATLAPFYGRYELLAIGAEETRFRHLRSTRGDRFTYVRLLLPELVDEPRVLYLDSDLVLGLDVADLVHRPLDGFAVGASGIGDFRWSNDHALCRSLGHDPAAPYFNAGVLLLDLDRWREDRLTERCLEFAREHAARIATADQTILNFVFYQAFKALGPEFNHLVFPDTPPLPADEDRRRIFHFVGAPKPWDLFGRQLHRNYGLYADVVRHTQMRGRRFYQDITWARVARTVRSIRAYASLLRSR